ncbi:DUF6036 family nucleotidyltransferase [uncultured Pseudacidovorax sp.]|uniref:DUF6036 family nucleotidyltransferase n=1 Tax=uncultured Pseudacidovorax sp. TaxID=679313 RepID=UPI0025FBA2E7|nr:DUF6036 family nucleotidyltransferase [uncultured Pseudacidovorax sp.]
MTREELEHIVRASADITNQYEFIVVGSQSILGALPAAPEVFRASREADIYPLQRPDLADAIDGAIGEGSQFHETYGYYAQGVGPETAVLPDDWMTRVHRVQGPGSDGKVAYCLDLPDLFLSKAVAGREKDRVFCIAMFVHGLVTLDKVVALIPRMGMLSRVEQQRLRRTLTRWALGTPSEG